MVDETLRDRLSNLEARMSRLEALYERDHESQERWQRSAIAILEEIKATNSRAHDDFAASIQIIANKVQDHAVTYARDKALLQGAAAVISLAVSGLVTGASAIAHWGVGK